MALSYTALSYTALSYTALSYTGLNKPEIQLLHFRLFIIKFETPEKQNLKTLILDCWARELKNKFKTPELTAQPCK